MSDDRSDAKNNMFYPLWSANGKDDNGYYRDGKDYTIAAGQSVEVVVSVDEAFTGEKDVIDVIQFLFDSSYGDSQKRSGNVDILYVEII